MYILPGNCLLCGLVHGPLSLSYVVLAKTPEFWESHALIDSISFSLLHSDNHICLLFIGCHGINFLNCTAEKLCSMLAFI